MDLQSSEVPVFVDSIGVGASCYDFLIEWGLNAYSCQSGQKATRMNRKEVLYFANLRAQWAWNLRELLDPDNGYMMALPPDDFELEEELTTIRWFSRGKYIYVESRDDLKKVERLGRSPDRFSALVLALSEFDD